MLKIYNEDNKFRLNRLASSATLIFGDCIYESFDFEWAEIAYDKLLPHGIFMVQTDLSTVAEWKIFLDVLFGKKNFLNMISVEFDWGGRSKRCFPHKTDYIFIYCKGGKYKFYPDRVLIPKATAGTNLDKKGTGLKIPTDFWRDMSFSTLSKERVKNFSGKNIQWQKPLKLMNRLFLPFTDENDLIVDPFLGSGTSGIWCLENNRKFIGIESDKSVYEIARKRLQDFQEK